MGGSFKMLRADDYDLLMYTCYPGSKMKELFVILCVICITSYQINGLKLIDIPKEYIKRMDIRSRLYHRYKVKPLKPVRPFKYQYARRQGMDINEAKDNTLKEKISFLIDQTINDAQKDMDSIQTLKARYNTTAGYRIGYLMYMVKRSRDVMNELFTVAVSHKDDWKALDQLKIFELIIHTNVDTSNLLRQLLDIAMKEVLHHSATPETKGARLRNLKVALL